MKLFINLGLPKTSCTNLQTQVYTQFKNIEYLGKKSFLVEKKYIGSTKTDRQKTLFTKINEYIEFRNESLVNDNYINKLKDEFNFFCKTCEKKILISNESWLIPYQKDNLTGKTVTVSQWEKLDRLKKLLKNLDIEVKYFIINRDPMEGIPSLYSTLHHLITDLFGRKYNTLTSFIKLYKKNKFNELKLFLDVYHVKKIKEKLLPDKLEIFEYSLLDNYPEEFLKQISNFLDIEVDPLLIKKISTRARVSKKTGSSYLVDDKFEFYFFLKKIIPKFLIKILKEKKYIVEFQKKFKIERKIDVDEEFLSDVLKNENII